MEWSSGEQACCSTGFPPRECSRNSSISVHQLALLWEAAFDFGDFFFFEDSFMMGDLQAHLSTLLSVQRFLTKATWPPCPTLPIHPILPQVTFLFVCFLGWKSPQREMFCWCRRGETKKGRSTERPQNKFKNCFEQWKNVLIGVLYQMVSTLKVSEV